jgi:hypothetical protein
MAKVKFTAVVADMRNKLNGSVFARNKGGAYIRTKVTPLNPKTAAQVSARNLLTRFAQKFRTLGAANIAAWNSVVSQWSTTDVFGDTINPSGSSLYTRLNINLAIAGAAELSTPPLPQGAAALSEISVVVDPSATAVNLTASPSTVPANHAFVLEATAGMSPGISNANNKFRVIAVKAAASNIDDDYWDEFVTKFGEPIVGQKIFIRGKFIRTTTGEVSQALSASAIAG